MIQTLYSEVISVGHSKDINVADYIRCDSFDNYSGDSQKIDNNLLAGMFDLLIAIAKSVEKSTATEPYSTAANYLFNTGWWTFTDAQSTEFSNFIKNGYTANTNRLGLFDSDYYQDNYWFHDSNQFVQIESCGGIAFYAGLLSSLPAYNKKDLIRISDLTNWNSLVFFDPRYRCIETPSELTAWINEFSNILTSIKLLDKKQERRFYPTSAPTIYDSATISASSYFNNEPWYDDLTMESGFLVVQSTDLGVMYNAAKTINEDDGQGGYNQYTYPTALPEFGLSFGANVLSIWTAIKDQGIPVGIDDTKYSYRKIRTDDDLPVGTNYYNETLTKNATTNILTHYNTIDVADNFYTVKNQPSYSVNSYLYITKAFGDGTSTNPWDSELTLRLPVLKEPSLIGNRYIVDAGTQYSVDLGMPNYPFTDYTEPNNITGAGWQTSTVTMYSGIDTTGSTTIDLSAPE